MAKAFPLLTVNPAGTMGENIPLMLHTRLCEMLFLARYIDDPRRITELHNMRIAAKRLRYTLELFLPYSTGAEQKSLSGLLDKTKKIQEMIGEIHDRDVRVPLLAEFLRTNVQKRPEIRLGLMLLIERESVERDRIYLQLLKYWNDQKAGYIRKMMFVIGTLGMGTDEINPSRPPGGNGRSKQSKAASEELSADRGDQ